MKNNLNEKPLSQEVHWLDIATEYGVKYKISGYVKVSKSEPKDAAVIMFDFGGYEMSVEQLKLYDLKHSAIGTYAYLPVDHEGICVWSYDIPIVENISNLRIGFRTWKNKNSIVLGTNVQIKKDYSFAKMHNELQKITRTNRELEIALLKEKQAVEKVKNTWSFQLGYILLHANKSWRNFVNLPMDLYYLRKNKKMRHEHGNRYKINVAHLDWKNITEAPFETTIHTTSENKVILKGQIITLESEKKNSALIKIDFLNVNIAQESAVRLGVNYSPKIGFFKYLPTQTTGLHEWEISFDIPKACKNVHLTFMPWYNNSTIEVTLAEESSIEQSKKKVEKKHSNSVKSTWHKKGFNDAELYIINVDVPSYHKADLYEVLASLEDDIHQKEKCYWLAYQKDATYHRAVNLFRRVVDGGYLSLAKKILSNFESKKYTILAKDHNNVMFAKGYTALYTALPKIPNDIVAHTSVNIHKVLMSLHTSLPHHSNGYATRSHAILRTLKEHSAYEVGAVTRSGYPRDVGISDFEKEDMIDHVKYGRLVEADYYKEPMDKYIETSANEFEQLLLQKRPSVVHAASAFHNALPALIAARRQGLAFVYEVRGLWEITRASTISNWGNTERYALEEALETLICTHADSVVTLTEGLKDELIRRGVKREKISIIPNAINKNQFTSIAEDSTLRNEIGLSDAPTIGYIGSIVTYEGLEDLVDALAILQKKDIAFNFLLIGDGNGLKGVKEKISEHKLEEVSFVMGRVPHDEVSRYYSLIDIAPFPRKAIAVCEMVSPLKPFEAMVQEKAIVASSVGALEEIINDDETGLLFEKENTEDLAKKLARLLLDEKLRKRLSKTAKKWVLENRDWAQIVPRFDKVYDEAFSKNQSNVTQKIESIVEKRPLSILVYGNLNLNYVDGSAIWAASIVEMLAGFKNVSITFLLKADLVHDTLITSLKGMQNVHIISPSDLDSTYTMLSPEEAIDVIATLQKSYQYDGIVLRGFELNKLAANKQVFYGLLWTYLVDIFQTKEKWDDTVVTTLKDIVNASHTLFCQTLHIQEFLEAKIPEVKGKTTLLPPMVPDQQSPSRVFELKDKPLKIVYAGKFAPLWGTREMIDTIKNLRTMGMNVELHVYGDKIHNPKDDTSFYAEIKEALSHTDGLIWHGAKPRHEVIAAMKTYDLAWAWRKAELEANTDEISTKFLEYASVGLPILVMENKITMKLLGKKYPLFANTLEALVPSIQQCLNEPHILAKASNRVYESSKEYFFSSIRNKNLHTLMDNLQNREKRKVILFAGHDLKFVDQLMDQFSQNGYMVLTDNWSGHDVHDEVLSRSLLARADIIFCEWAMGNAVWYSKHKLSFQKLFVRLHLQEKDTEFPSEIKYASVDKFIFISPFIQREVTKKFALAPFQDKLMYIPNYVKTENLNLVKKPNARFNLGIVGIVPERKRFDRALDILEALRKKDERYQLFVKGKIAKDFPWMLKRTEEMKYYENLDARIASSKYLKGAVHFDGFGKEMGEWFSKIGYILSPSDFEGSHLSIAEAMVSGTSPIIITWAGADEIYPKKYCFDTTKEAISYIEKETDERYEKSIHENQKAVVEFDLKTIYASWEKLL